MNTNDAKGAAVLVLTSVGDDEAAGKLSRLLVQENLAACVTRSATKSVYRWEAGTERAPRDMALCEDDEVMLLIKTSRSRVAVLEGRLREVHPYECPEFVVVEAAHVEARYLAWLLGCVD